KAPFVKVEATKFTEVGYVGRDVESMVRDLVETALIIVKEERMETVKEKAEKSANRRLVKLLVPEAKKQRTSKNPFEMLFPGMEEEEEQENPAEKESMLEKRKQIRKLLALGELEEEQVTVEIEQSAPSMFDMLQGSGMENMGTNMQDAFSQLMPAKKMKRRLPVKEARHILIQQEAQKMIDMDEVQQEAVHRAEQAGIIFIDEIDKIVG